MLLESRFCWLLAGYTCSLAARLYQGVERGTFLGPELFSLLERPQEWPGHGISSTLPGPAVLGEQHLPRMGQASTSLCAWGRQLAGESTDWPVICVGGSQYPASCFYLGISALPTLQLLICLSYVVWGGGTLASSGARGRKGRGLA